MCITVIHHQGQLRVGRLSADGQHIELFAVDGRQGALALIGLPSLPPVDATVPLAGAVFAAPIPVPHRNLFCVGRNYHAHAKELRDTVFKDNAQAVDAWPIVFTKVPQTVVAHGPASSPRGWRSTGCRSIITRTPKAAMARARI